MKSTFTVMLSVLICLALSGCSQRQQVVVKGSETMRSMMEMLADDFNSSQNRIEVTVAGGGSESGIRELASGGCDIALSSNDIDDSVLGGIRTDDVVERVIVAYDGIAIVVNRANVVDYVDCSQASGIFSGRITRWSQLGGADEEIKVVIRNEDSGTGAYMREHILRKKDLGEDEYRKNRDTEYYGKAVAVENNYQLIDYLRKNPYAVGFIGMGYAMVDGSDKLKALRYSVRRMGTYVSPSIETVNNREYRLSRPLMLIYRKNGDPSRDSFVSYVLGDMGQKLVRSSGYLGSSFPEVVVTGRRE